MSNAPSLKSFVAPFAEVETEFATQRADDQLLSRVEAARVLNVSPDSLAAWASTGKVKIPFVKIGRRALYRRSDLRRFIEANVRGSVGEVQQ